MIDRRMKFIARRGFHSTASANLSRNRDNNKQEGFFPNRELRVTLARGTDDGILIEESPASADSQGGRN